MSGDLIKSAEVSNYLEKSQKLKELLDNSKNVNKDNYILNFSIAVANNQSIANCSNQSLLQCCLTSLQFELPIDSRNFCYLIPYSNQATIRVSYYGLLELAKRNPDIVDIDTFLVYKDDKFTLKKTPDGDSYELEMKITEHTPEDVICGVCHVKRKSAPDRIVIMMKSDIDKAQQASKSKNVWNQWYFEMAKKTTIRRALKLFSFENINKVFSYEDAQDYNTDKTEDIKEDVNKKWADIKDIEQ